ncbi:uncharacterized protein DS421_12g361300 [Arachis hypogaea]|nr:uncharacterized protein DS421_12g361300 [Arachis hypogaea]
MLRIKMINLWMQLRIRGQSWWEQKGRKQQRGLKERTHMFVPLWFWLALWSPWIIDAIEFGFGSINMALSLESQGEYLLQPWESPPIGSSNDAANVPMAQLWTKERSSNHRRYWERFCSCQRKPLPLTPILRIEEQCTLRPNFHLLVFKLTPSRGYRKTTADERIATPSDF